MMRRILILSLAVLFSIVSYAQDAVGVKWEKGTLQEALDKAKNSRKGPKLVFLDCYTTWCGPCKRMTENVFTTKEAGDYFNRNYVNIKIDMEKGEGVALAKKLQIKAYPTFVILDENGNEIGRVVGGGPLDNFIKKVEKAKQVENSPKALLEKYNQTKAMEDAYAYLELLRSLAMRESIHDFMKENYDNIPEPERYTEKFWKFLRTAIVISDVEVLNKIIDEKYEFDYRCGEGIINDDIFGHLKAEIISYLDCRMEAPAENVKQACRIMMLCGKLGYYERFLVKAAQALANEEYDRFVALYDPNYLSFIHSSMEISIIKSFLLKNKNISDEQKAKFFRGYQDMLELYLESNGKDVARFKDVVVPEENISK